MKKPKPKRKVAAKWRKQHFIGEALAGIPFVAFLFAGAFWSRWFFLLALLAFAVGFTLQRLKFRRCACETCGAELRRAMQDGAHIEFYCEACNTIWTAKVVQDGAPVSL